MSDLPTVDLTRFRIHKLQCLVQHATDRDEVELRVSASVNIQPENQAGEIIMRKFIKPFDCRAEPKDLIKHCARQLLISTLIHELDECLFVDGKQDKDPHAPEYKS